MFTRLALCESFLLCRGVCPDRERDRNIVPFGCASSLLLDDERFKEGEDRFEFAFVSKARRFCDGECVLDDDLFRDFEPSLELECFRANGRFLAFDFFAEENRFRACFLALDRLFGLADDRLERCLGDDPLLDPDFFRLRFFEGLLDFVLFPHLERLLGLERLLDSERLLELESFFLDRDRFREEELVPDEEVGRFLDGERFRRFDGVLLDDILTCSELLAEGELSLDGDTFFLADDAFFSCWDVCPEDCDLERWLIA